MTGDPTVVGLVGELTVATRGADGPGEALIRIRGGSETFLAWSDEPLPRGQAVLVVQARESRALDVVAWTADPAWPRLD